MTSAGAFMESWSPWLVDSFIAFSALLLLVLILRRPVARWFGPEAAYLLWALPALRWLMPPLAFESVGLTPITTWFSDANPPAAITDMPADPAMIVDAGGVASSAVASSTAASSAVHTVIDLATFLPALWLAGAVGLFAFLLRHHFKIMGAVKAQADPLGTIGRIALYESDVPTSPLASGLFSRSIFIPQSIRHWPEEAQRMAVAHEMTHHRSLHLIHNSIALALLCLNWFNPLAWAAARAFIVDQEADCDARTIAKYQFDRADYATMLLEAAKVSRAPSWGLAPALAPHAHLIPRKALVARIRRISMNKNDRTLRFAGYGLAFAAGVALLPLTASIAEADDKVQNKSTSITSNDEGTSAIRISGGGEPIFRRNVSYKGKSYALWSDRDMSDAEVHRQLAQGEKAAASADEAMRKADAAMRDADAAMRDADRATREADAAARDAAAAADKAERQAAWAADEAARQGAREGEQEARRAAAQAAREAAAEARWAAEEARREAIQESRRAAEEARREGSKAAREAQLEAQKEARADAIAAAKEARAEAQAQSIRARAEAQANVARIRAEAARNAVASVDWNGVRASVDGATATATANGRTIRIDTDTNNNRN